MIDQGDADRYARWFAEHLNPREQLDRFVDRVAITFELGEADLHVPAENAREFREALVAREPGAGERIRIQRHAQLDHRGVTISEAALNAAATCLAPSLPGPPC